MGYQVKGARQHQAARLLASHVKKAAEIPYPACTLKVYVMSVLNEKKGISALK
jgi:hypothetical protein